MIKDKKNVGFWKWRLKKMSKSAIGYIFSFIILVLLQVSVFNRIKAMRNQLHRLLLCL